MSTNGVSQTSLSAVPTGEIEARLAVFRAALQEYDVAGALILEKTDRYYLTGTAQEGALYLPTIGDPQLWVLRDAARAGAESPLEVRAVGSWRELWAACRRAIGRGTVGLAADATSLTDLQRLELSSLERVRDVGPSLLRQRSRKSPWEGAQLERAGQIADQLFAYIAEILRPGMSEAGLAGRLFARAMELGHEGHTRGRGRFEPYFWHVLSGPNVARAGAIDTPTAGEGMSPATPTGAGQRRIQAGEPVLVDFAVNVFGYQTDQARTFCVGEPPDWLAATHKAIEEIHRQLRTALRPGAQCGEVFAAGAAAADATDLFGYLGPEGGKCRFVGHGVGLEVVEPPILARGSTATLEAGMALAVEPKAVVGTVGGAGLEDTYWIGERETRPLSRVPTALVTV